MSEHSLQSSHSIGIPLTNAVPSAIEQDDLLLVSASKNGDQEAFAQLVQRYQRRVFNLVYRMLEQYEDATEITQETFLAAWQGLPAFRGDARFPTWLYRIAYNCSLKQIELRKRGIVLILRHLQDMTYEEMAEILTMPIGTIKTHLFRARNLLKERLQSLNRESDMG